MPVRVAKIKNTDVPVLMRSQQLNCHTFLAGWIAKPVVTVENSLSVYYRTTTWPVSPIPGYPRYMKIGLHKIPYTNVYGSSAHNIQTQVLVSACLDKQAVVHPYTGTLLSSEKEQTCCVLQPGWISKAWCWVKEVSLKSFHSVWFHAYNSHSIVVASRSVVARGGGSEMDDCKGEHRGI